MIESMNNLINFMNLLEELVAVTDPEKRTDYPPAPKKPDPFPHERPIPEPNKEDKKDD